MHEYQPKSFTPDQETKLRNSSGRSRCVENFLTDDEFEFCRTLINQPIDWPEHGKVAKYWGFGWNDTVGQQLQWLKPKIDQLLPDWELDFFALQEAITPWKIHADIRWYPDKLPYKVIIIPLDVEPESGPVSPENWPDTYTLSFNQRNFLSRWETKVAKTGNVQDHWIRPCDSIQTENLVPGYHITKDFWEEHLTHMPYEHLEGLTLDQMHKWAPKSLLWHDNSALHCADNFLANKIKTKRCLMLFTILKQ